MRRIVVWGAALAAGVTLVVGGALAAERHHVDVRDNTFAEERIEITAGDTVVWEQTGSNPHSVTADDGSWDSHPDCPPNFADCMQEGDTFERTFEEEGEIAYHCKVHGGPDGQGMAGVVLVRAAADEPDQDRGPSQDAPGDPPPADDGATAVAGVETAPALAATGPPLAALTALGALLVVAGALVRHRPLRP